MPCIAVDVKFDDVRKKTHGFQWFAFCCNSIPKSISSCKWENFAVKHPQVMMNQWSLLAGSFHLVSISLRGKTKPFKAKDT